MTNKKSMPPELLEHFKKKQEGKKGDDGDHKSEDKDRRKEAVKKARIRMEEKSRKNRDDQKEKTNKGRSESSRAV